MKRALRYVSPAVALLAASYLLAACDTGEGVECASDTECLTGFTCQAGSCVAAGAGASGLAGSGVAGSAMAGGNGAGGGSVGGGAGSGALAGSGSGGNGNGSSGSSGQGGFTQAGSGNVAGASNGGSGSDGGAGNSGGSGGMGGSGNVVGECKDDFLPPANNGSVTRYDFKQGTSLPACAYVITHTGSGSDGDWDTVEGISTGDGGYFGAMNTTDYAQGAVCGACVEATYNGRKVVLTIVDECPVGSNPKCQKGHIDLSRKAIRQLEPNGQFEDLQNVSWRYVKCPAAGNVKARLHPNQNSNWQPVVIENGLYPLKSVSLNGVSATRSGNNVGGNAWIADKQKPPYAVYAVDVNGNAISFNFSGGNNLADAGTQFVCQ